MVHIEFTLTYLQIYLIAINLLSFIVYSYDKSVAIQTTKNISRVSENKLLLSSFIGGSIGSLISMFLFRHKIKKSSFIIKFSIMFLVQIALVYLYIRGVFSFDRLL